MVTMRRNPTSKNKTQERYFNDTSIYVRGPNRSPSLYIGAAQLEPVRALIHPYAADDEIVPGITAIAAPGHTLGHHAFLLHDGNDKLLHLMDAAVHYLVGPEEPDWALAVEMEQTAAADTRRKLFKQAADQNLFVAGYHFPFPGIGKIVSDQNAWRFVPMQTA